MTTELMQFLLPYFEKLVLGLDIFAICLLIWEFVCRLRIS